MLFRLHYFFRVLSDLCVKRVSDLCLYLQRSYPRENVKRVINLQLLRLSIFSTFKVKCIINKEEPLPVTVNYDTFQSSL